MLLTRISLFLSWRQNRDIYSRSMIQCHTFIPVAHHWENEVTWHCTKSPYPHSSCLVFPDGHRQKEGWYPRRTVDYQNLNAQCLRETHPCESPFHLASRVPPTTKKTVINLSCCWTWRRKSTLNGDVICICECPRGSQVLAMLTLVGATTSKMSVQKGKNHTCLQTDWCEHGIGYLLLQKHCSCHDQSQVTCCPTSWKLIFTLPAEIRYKATEGEALAVSWSLKHSRMFTTFKNVYSWMWHLVISVDHEPWLGILNNLGSISNPRIQNLKESTFGWKFDIVYDPGKWHQGPDAMSCNPSLSAIRIDDTSNDSFLDAIKTTGSEDILRND